MINSGFSIKDVLYSMLGPDLLCLTVAVWNIPISGAIGAIAAESGH